jgi:NitT/TauT family transport system permease protein
MADLGSGFLHGELALDIAYTAAPAVVGLVLGALVGMSVGFALVAWPSAAKPISGVIAFLGAFPVFAVAPMTLIWFGLGLGAKVFLAFLGCVFVFLQGAYSGGRSVPDSLTQHLKVHGFSPWQVVVKARLPFATVWMFNSLRTAAGLALLGVFIGEFVAAEHGLAREMIDQGSIYNVKRVLSAGLCFAGIALFLIGLADEVQRIGPSLLRWLSVPRWVMRGEGDGDGSGRGLEGAA